MTAKLRRNAPRLSRMDGAVVVTDHFDGFAPEAPEYRTTFARNPSTETLRASFEEMARSDPEFLEWRRAERLGDLFGRNGR